MRYGAVMTAVLLLAPGPLARAQEVPSLVGVWTVEYTLGEEHHTLSFRADPPQFGEIGTGTFVVKGLPVVPPEVPVPAVWDQISPELVSFTGEIEFPLGNVGNDPGTLIFKGTFTSADTIAGTSIFVSDEPDPDDHLGTGFITKTGSFVATRDAGSTPPCELSSCAVKRTSDGQLYLEVNAPPDHPFVAGVTVILFDGRRCRRYVYPKRFTNNGSSTQIRCYGVKRLLPSTIVADTNGTLSTCSLPCAAGGR